MKLLISTLLFLITFSAFAQTNQDKVKIFFDTLSKDNMKPIDVFYHPQVEFIDPVGEIKGSEKIKIYYENMYKNVKELKFEFMNFVESENQVVAIWKMHLTTDKLNGGEPYTVEGNSVIRFDESGKAIYHRDYFDMGSFVYEKIPVVGFVIKKIKARFQAEEK
jgi:limonene-1,2-epoxide hydrolase